MSLRKKTIKGLAWSAVSQGGKQVSQIIITMILARLLSPEDFGLVAMATVFTNFALLFGEMGLSSALIQKQDIDDRHLSSAFWLNVIAGACLTLFFIIVAPLIAAFYHKPQLQPLLMVMSLNFILTSFTIIQQTIFTKEMDFKPLTIRDIASVVVAGIVGIFMANHGFGAWSLVGQLLTFSFVNGILLWTMSSWRPKFMFSKDAIKDIFHFSAHMTGFNIVNYFARNVDQLLIGKFLGSQALGYYALAYKIMLYPVQNISGIIGRVMFPAFSRIQHDLEKVRSAYLKMVKAISLITFPLMAGLFVLAPEFVHIVFGAKWEPIILVLKILCICGAVQSIGTTVGNIILSQGRSELQLRLGVISIFFVFLAVLLGMRWGVAGVAAFYTYEQILWFFYVQRISNHLIKLDNKRFFSVFKKSLLIGVFLCLCVYLVKCIIITK